MICIDLSTSGRCLAGVTEAEGTCLLPTSRWTRVWLSLTSLLFHQLFILNPRRRPPLPTTKRFLFVSDTNVWLVAFLRRTVSSRVHSRVAVHDEISRHARRLVWTKRNIIPTYLLRRGRPGFFVSRLETSTRPPRPYEYDQSRRRRTYTRYDACFVFRRWWSHCRLENSSFRPLRGAILSWFTCIRTCASATSTSSVLATHSYTNDRFTLIWRFEFVVDGTVKNKTRVGRWRGRPECKRRVFVGYIAERPMSPEHCSDENKQDF